MSRYAPPLPGSIEAIEDAIFVVDGVYNAYIVEPDGVCPFVVIDCDPAALGAAIQALEYNRPAGVPILARQPSDLADHINDLTEDAWRKGFLAGSEATHLRYEDEKMASARVFAYMCIALAASVVVGAVGWAL